MAAATQIEIQSFVDKFSHLSSLCYNSSLEFKSFQGNVSVSFQANLGVINQTPQPLTHILTQQHQVKPCRVRRRNQGVYARDDAIVEENMQQAIFESDPNEDRINENDEDYGLTSNASSLHNDVCMPAAEHDDQELTNPDDIDIAAACNPTPSVHPFPYQICLQALSSRLSHCIIAVRMSAVLEALRLIEVNAAITDVDLDGLSSKELRIMVPVVDILSRLGINKT